MGTLAEDERQPHIRRNDTGERPGRTAEGEGDAETPAAEFFSHKNEEQRVAGAHCRATVARIQRLKHNTAVKLDCFFCGNNTGDVVTHRLCDASFCDACYASLITSTFQEALRECELYPQ